MQAVEGSTHAAHTQIAQNMIQMQIHSLDELRSLLLLDNRKQIKPATFCHILFVHEWQHIKKISLLDMQLR
jgi:hypothetical protein